MLGKKMTISHDRADTSVKVAPLLVAIGNTSLHVTPEQFDILCLQNPDLRLELSQQGELIVMPPTGGETGEKNADLIADAIIWNRQTLLGRVFDSSTGYDFTAMGGGKISPDLSWIENSRLEGIDISGFIPIVPDFAVELRSKTDNSSDLQAKMREYQRLGVKLGLLINPQGKTVEIYQPGGEVRVLESPMSVDCSHVMPGFVLNLARIW
jgi:Uma2 family endonuclease